MAEERVEVHVWIIDVEGYQVSALDSWTTKEAADAFYAEVAKQGRATRAKFDAAGNALDAPPKRPDPHAVKMARLAALRAKGWANLTAAERTEADELRFDLGA